MEHQKTHSFIILSIYKTSFKEKSVFFKIRTEAFHGRWITVITILLVYRKDQISDNKMSYLKARSRVWITI